MGILLTLRGWISVLLTDGDARGALRWQADLLTRGGELAIKNERPIGQDQASLSRGMQHQGNKEAYYTPHHRIRWPSRV